MPAMTLHGPDGFGLTQYSGDEYALVGGFRDGASNAGELRLKYQIYSHALIAANDGNFEKGEIGYCVVRVASDDGPDQGEILGLIDIELKPKYRKSGHGKKIVRDIVDTTKSGNLDIHDIQKKAKKFWDKMGVEYDAKKPGAQNAVLRKQSEQVDEDMPDMAPVYPNIKSGINDAYSSIDEIDYAIVRLQKTIAEEYGDDIPDEYQEPLDFIIDIMNKKLPSALRHIADIAKNDEVYESINEDLRAWFGKGKKGGAGGGGWDRYNTKGERIGKCGDAKDGEGKPKCLSKSRAASLRSSGGKKAIANAVKRKKAKDPNPNRKGKAKNVNSHPKK